MHSIMNTQNPCSEMRGVSGASDPLGGAVFLCLHPSCLGAERLLCNLSLERETHMRHPKVLVHQSVEPFARLNNNKCSVSAKDTYKKMRSSIETLKKSIHKAEKYFLGQIHDLKANLIDAMETISGTYDNEMIKNSVRICSNGLTCDDRPSELDKIAQRIIFLTKYQFSSPEMEISKFKVIEKEGLEVIEQSVEAISKNLRNMKERFKQLKANLVENVEAKMYEERKDDMMVLTTKRLERSDRGSKREKKLSLMHVPEPVSYATVNKMEEENSIEIPFHSISSRLQSQVSSNLPKLDTSVVRQVRNRSVTKSRRRSKVKVEQSDMLDEKGELVLQQQVKQTKTLVINQRDGSSSSEEDLSSVTRLVVENINKGVQALCSMLPKMVKLQEVSVYDIDLGSQSNIMQFMKALPPSIRRLYLSCANDFGINCVNLLNSRKLHKITHLEYFFDVVRDMRRVDESLYFKEKSRGIRIQPIKFEDACLIANYFPRIKNAWVPLKINTSGGRKIPLQQLENLVIGELDEDLTSRVQIQVQIPKRLVNSLIKTKNLKSLSLLNVQLSDVTLLEVLNNNIQLEAIYLECCHTITEIVMENISPEGNLVTFSIKDCPKIHGKFVERLHKTKIFIMDNSDISDKVGAAGFQDFSGLNSLVYLNLYGHYYFNDKLVGDLKSSAESLKSLNIGMTSITSDCAAYFNLPNLECLCMDENKVDMQAVMAILEQTPKMKKLSLCGYNGENGKGELTNEHIQIISHLLPELTHLSIKFCSKLRGKWNMEAFKNLRYVEVECQDLELIESLKQAGVEVPIDE